MIQQSLGKGMAQKAFRLPVVFAAGDVLQELGAESRTYDKNDVREFPDQNLTE